MRVSELACSETLLPCMDKLTLRRLVTGTNLRLVLELVETPNTIILKLMLHLLHQVTCCYICIAKGFFACISHPMMGVASIGTGAKRFFSFLFKN